MPKAYSANERSFIKQRLMEEAKQCLSSYGVRKTTVDELVKRVNIPKGTFYLFYESKELLFFDVFRELHDEMNQKLFTQIAQAKGEMTADRLTDIIFGLYEAVEGSFLLQLMTNGEMELLIRKLPPEVATSHALQDDLSVETLLSLVPHMKMDDIEGFSAALRAIFLSMLHKHEIGDDAFGGALKIMIRGVVTQMFEGSAI